MVLASISTLLGQRAGPGGAVARCGDGGFVLVGTGASTCAGHGGVAEWFDKNEEARAAADAKERAAQAVIEAEQKRVADEAERKRAAAERVKATASRAKADADRAKAETERKRKEAEPLVRVTESQARALLSKAATQANNDADTFTKAVVLALAPIAPDFRGPQVVSASDALDVVMVGPLGNLFAAVREKVRKFEALVPPPVWSPVVHVLVQPHQIGAPDIEKIVVQRNGSVIAPLRTALTASEFVSRTNAKQLIHSGEVTYPLNAFEPGLGVTVTVIAIPRIRFKY